MATWTDPDATPAKTEAAKTGQAAKAGDVTSQVKATASTLDQATSGRGPDSFGGTAAEVRSALSAVADTLTVPPAIAKAAEKAFHDFNAHAPSATELNDAEKKVADTKAANDAALAAPGADTPGTDADKAAWDTSRAYQAALTKLRELKEERRLFREVLFDALRRAIAMARQISAGVDQGDTGTGYGTPDAPGSGTGSGYGKPGVTTGPVVRVPALTPGTPAPKSPGTSAPKAPGTPAPKSETPGNGKPDMTSQALAALAAQQNQQQNQQPQQAQAAPAAQTQPQQATQPQNQQKPGEKSDLEREAEKNARTVLEAAGLESPLGLVGAPIQATGPGAPPQSAPSGQHGYSPRPGVVPAGTTSGGTPLSTAGAQQVTTGDSKHGMTTQSDTSGRSEPQRTGINDGLKTTTSGASPATTAQSQAATQQTGRGAMPMMPMLPPMGAPAPGGGGAPRSDGDKDRTHTSSNSDGGMNHGQDAQGEGVRGGTICQNKPDTPDKAA